MSDEGDLKQFKIEECLETYIDEEHIDDKGACVRIKTEIADDHGDIKPECSNDLDYKPSEDIDSLRKRREKRKCYKKQETVMKCDQCEYNTVYRHCLEKHVRGHITSKPFKCEFCNYKCGTQISLNRHIVMHHDYKEKGGKAEFKCSQCVYTGQSKWKLHAHMRKHKEEKEFRCEHCAYATSHKRNFIRHSKVAHREDNKNRVMFKCDLCPFITKFDRCLIKHLAQIHNEVIEKTKKCYLCDFYTLVGWRLIIHKLRSKQEECIKCTYCDFETYYRCESKKHKEAHINQFYEKSASDIDREYKAEITIKPKDTVDNIINDLEQTNTITDEHQLNTNNTNNMDYIQHSFFSFITSPDLDMCDAYVDSNPAKPISELKVQENKKNCFYVIESDKERMFQCIKCIYASKYKASVQRHYQRHHMGSNVRPFKCENCKFTTKTKDQISLHNKRSKSNTIISCNLCEYTTKFKCQYVEHQKTHYIYKCTVCNYSCKQKFGIQRHFTTVHLDSGLKCRFCDFKAKEKESTQS